MQSAEMRLCEDPADTLNFARNRRVLVERQMRAGPVVICHVYGVSDRETDRVS